MNRLAVLRASPTLAHVRTTRPERLHQLSQDRDEQFAVDIKGPHRLIFEVDHDPIPRNADGGINRAAVTDILITEVSNHYE
jgi:toxin HigB-1